MNKKTIWVLVALLAAAVPAIAGENAPIIGEVEQVFTLDAANQVVRGVAFDEFSPETPRLFVLDETGQVFIYRLERDAASGKDGLVLAGKIELPRASDGTALKGVRGLAYGIEDQQDVLYFLVWNHHPTLDGQVDDLTSQLWKYNLSDKTTVTVNLTLYPFRIGEREPFDLAYGNGKIFVSFDGSGYHNASLRVHRGIIQLEWNRVFKDRMDFIKHLPDSGEKPALGLACMGFEGARYLWGTVGPEFIYSADEATGRGLFYFASPVTPKAGAPSGGLTYGAGSLWIPENSDGPDKIHRVNVTRNLDAAYAGPRMLRHLELTIETTPRNQGTGEPGKVFHNFSRPYPNDQMPNQGTWPETESLEDLSGAPNAKARIYSMDPAGDKAFRQFMGTVEYAEAPAQTYKSRYRIDIWTNPWRKYIYPHRVNLDVSALKGTDYLADDPVLYNLTDRDTYDAFFKRVKAHILAKYGVRADMTNPYWAARNIVEYIQDHYYYPSRPKGIPASVDYDRNHYDANPGNLKIDLSRGEYNKDEIIACSGTSVMVAGAMRYLGFPARWLGTGTEFGPAAWDDNKNGLLDEGETAGVSSGHRYTQVWLGSEYGWVCFDATPTKPDNLDFDPVPPVRPQWRFMNRTAAGHLKDKRIVFNVGSTLVKQLYRDFLYDEKLAVNNDCGGDQRYNAQGRFEKPELWKLSRHSISVTNMCFLTDVTVTPAEGGYRVSWALKGQWDKDPAARLEICLQKQSADGASFKPAGLPASGLSPQAGSAEIDLSGYDAGTYRVIVRKVGDRETGGMSAPFDFK